jgi:hypothetical protein
LIPARSGAAQFASHLDANLDDNNQLEYWLRCDKAKLQNKNHGFDNYSGAKKLLKKPEKQDPLLFHGCQLGAEHNYKSWENKIHKAVQMPVHQLLPFDDFRLINQKCCNLLHILITSLRIRYYSYYSNVF